MLNREFALRFFAIPIRLMPAELQKSLGRVDPVPPTYVRGFGALPFGEIRNIHPVPIGLDGAKFFVEQRSWNGVHSRTQVRGVLSFDLPVRQAQGPEALEGEALDRWFGVDR